MQPKPARSFNANCQLVTVVTVVRPNNSRQLSWVRRFIFICVTVGSNFLYSFISPFLFRHPSNTQFTNIQDSFKGCPGRDNLQEQWDNLQPFDPYLSSSSHLKCLKVTLQLLLYNTLQITRLLSSQPTKDRYDDWRQTQCQIR